MSLYFSCGEDTRLTPETESPKLELSEEGLGLVPDLFLDILYLHRIVYLHRRPG